MTAPNQSTMLRDAELSDLSRLLQDLRTRALDIVVPAGRIGVEAGSIVIKGEDPVLSDDGVDDINGTYAVGAVALEGIAAKLDIPVAYLRRTRTCNGSARLFDFNVKSWLWANRSSSYLLRVLRDPDGGGRVRAFLSDRYRCIDNLDSLLAVLAGLRDGGIVSPDIRCDLTERRMYVRISTPEIFTESRELLRRYVSPFGGELGRDNPVVFAGLVVSNSETGNGAFSITPRITVQVCSNGMTVTKDAHRAVHLGGRLEAGVIDWSPETQRKQLELITAQTTDAVRKFLSPGYLRGVVDAIERDAGTPVTDAPRVIEAVSKRLGFTKDQASGILDMFIRGADLTAGGVMQAVTAHARTLPDADAAAELEDKALDALAAAAR